MANQENTNECVGIAGNVSTSAREAAEYWARHNFTPGRKITNLELIPGAIDMQFSLVGGRRRYMAQWDEKLQQYRIMVISN